MAVWTKPKPCPCGSAFPRLKSLQGRKDWSMQSVFIRHFGGVSLNEQIIRQWQFEQTDPGSFTFRYVALKTDDLEQNLNKLEASFKTALGANAQIQMEPVPEIHPSPSGKMVWVKNRC